MKPDKRSSVKPEGNANGQFEARRPQKIRPLDSFENSRLRLSTPPTVPRVTARELDGGVKVMSWNNRWVFGPPSNNDCHIRGEREK